MTDVYRDGDGRRYSHNGEGGITYLDAEPVIDPPEGQLLEIMTAQRLAQRVAALPEPGYLASPVFPADAYGVLAAEWKAGKTWAVLDLAISVAAGDSWFGLYPAETPGPALVFLGEGGERKMERRARAISEAKGLSLDDLPLYLCFRSPHLRSTGHLDEIQAFLDAIPAALVVVDPLYLAARGAKASALYDMGETLEGIQHVCQKAGAALLVATHWNRGEGNGSKRITGAGPAEWGRVLVNVSVRSKRADPATGGSVVFLEVGFEGDELADQRSVIRRKVWADDPGRLSSPLHYEVEQVLDAPTEADELSGLRPSERRVMAALAAVGGPGTVSQIGDALAADSTGQKPLKARTIQDCLARLDRWTDDDKAVPPAPRRYWLNSEGEVLIEAQKPP